MRKFLKHLIRSIALYLLIVAGGTFSFMSITAAFGYVPYSDPHNRYWFTRSSKFSWDAYLHEVNLYFGFALLLALYATVTGIAIVMTASGMAWFRVPRWIVRTVAVLMATILTGWITLGLGWFINLSAGATYFAMLLGFLFGACVLKVESVRRVSSV